MVSRWRKLASSMVVVVLLASEAGADPLDHSTRLSIPGSPDFRAVADDNGHYAATGDGGAIYTSTDAFSWTPCQSGSTGCLWSVAYGNGVFVTGDFAQSSSTVLTSTVGTNWTSSPFVTYPMLRGIGFAKGVFFAAHMGLHNEGRIATSQDGTHWSERQLTPYPNLACTYGNGVFLCAGGQA